MSSYIDFSRWRPQCHNSASGFAFGGVLYWTRSKCTRRPNFDDVHVSIYGWDITTSDFGKWTTAILEFHVQLLILTWYRQRRVILHWLTKFHLNWTTPEELWCHIKFSRCRESTDVFWRNER